MIGLGNEILVLGFKFILSVLFVIVVSVFIKLVKSDSKFANFMLSQGTRVLLRVYFLGSPCKVCGI